MWYIYVTSSLFEYILLGPVSIMNLRDITTQSDLHDMNAVFAFDIHPRISSTAALGYRVRIQWSQLGMQFRSYNGTHTVYLPPEGPSNCRGTSNTTLELVGTGSYKLTVPTAVFDFGPLFINMSVSLVCLPYTYASYYCPICSQWRYTGQASIDISAKRGMNRAPCAARSASCMTLQHCCTPHIRSSTLLWSAYRPTLHVCSYLASMLVCHTLVTHFLS